VSAKRNSQDAKWGGAICQLPSLTALLSVLPVVFICLLFAFVPVPDVQAASAYLADENGQTEITVDVNDEFHVVLYIVDITDLAGYECKITVSGPATPIGSAVHGDWFADGHILFGPFEIYEDEGEPAPADYNTAMLLSPSKISGSGAVVVFTLHADDDGIVAINVDSEYFLFGDKYAQVIEVDLPSTLYVTVGTGEGDQGGESAEQPSEESAPDSGGDSFDPEDIDIYVNGAHTGTESGTINEPYNTIQEAMAAASGGELIGVAAGAQGDLTYSENLQIDKTVHLQGGLDPSSWERTNYHSIVSAASSSSPTVEYLHLQIITEGSIRGFTIRGGKGGIRCNIGTAPRIECNAITGNGNGVPYGGGIYCLGSDDSVKTPTITRNTITENSAGQGGGIRCYGYGASTNGPGRFPLIEKNTITGNSASSYGGGIAISLCDGVNMAACIVNNIIADNVAGSYGGGVHSFDSKNISLFHNTIVGNSVDRTGSSLYGGGLLVNSTTNFSSSASIHNCIFWNNTSKVTETEEKGDEIAVVLGSGGTAAVGIDYSDICGALDYMSEGIFASSQAFSDAHNINEDPVLTSGWRLDEGSPCIDAGGSCGWMYDIDSNLRPFDGDDKGGAGYDMGAHEYGASQTWWQKPGDADLDGRVTVLDLIIIRNLLGQDRCLNDNWKADVNVDGKINILDLIYTRNRLGT